jgi:hypothetical protein
MYALRPLLVAVVLLTARIGSAQSVNHDLCDRLATLTTREQYRAQAERLIATGGAGAEFLRGCLAWDDRSTDASIGYFEKAASDANATSDYYLWLGNAYGVKAQRANPVSQAMLARKTKSAFEKAVALDGNNVEARYGLLQYYMMAPGIMGGSMTKAEEQGREIKRRNLYRGGMALASLASRRKDTPAIERELKAVREAFPDSINAANSLLNLYMAGSRWSESWALIDTLESGKLTAHARLPFLIGRTAAVSGQQLARGEAALTRYLAKPAARGEPQHSAAQVRLAQILEKQGKVDAAKAAYRAALAQDAKNEDAKKGLKALEK